MKKHEIFQILQKIIFSEGAKFSLKYFKTPWMLGIECDNFRSRENYKVLLILDKLHQVTRVKQQMSFDGCYQIN